MRRYGVAAATQRRRRGIAEASLRRHRGVAVHAASPPRRYGDVAAPLRRRRGDLAATPPRRRDDAKPISLANISCSQHFRAAVNFASHLQKNHKFFRKHFQDHLVSLSRSI